jgi:VWFA-related protein
LTLAILLLVAPLAAQRPLASSGDVVTVSVINVEALVTDKQGEPVTGLGREDFELTVDGKPVAVEYFEPPAGAVPAPSPPAGPAAPAAETTEPEPTHLVVFVDNSELRQASRLRVLARLEELLVERLPPTDRILIVSHDPGLHVRLGWTTDREAVKQAIARLKAVPVGGDEIDRARRRAFDDVVTLHVAALSEFPPRPCSPEIVVPAHSHAQDRRRQVLAALGSLTAVVSSLAGTPGQKALLHVSDGLPVMPGADVFEYLYQICGGGITSGLAQLETAVVPRGGIGGQLIDPELAATKVFDAMLLGPKAYQGVSQAPLDAQSYNIAKHIETLAAHANSRRVTLYTLQASGLEPDGGRTPLGPGQRLLRFPSIERIDRQGRQDTLFALAKATGGKAILDANEPLPDLLEMRRDLASLYSLGFSFGERADGSHHRIDVRVKRPGLKVRHRESFRDKTEAERAADRALATLFWNSEDNPLEIDISVGEVTKSNGDLYLVPVRLKIPLFKLGIVTRETGFEGNLRLVVVTRNPEGTLSPVRVVPVPIRIPRKEVLHAMGQYYLYTLTLKLPAGEQRVAVGVRDELQKVASYLGQDLHVAVPELAKALPSDGR